MNEFIAVVKKYAVFDGRAGRREFWMFTLVNAILGTVLFTVSDLLYGAYGLALFLPSLGVAIRRLHDTNRSGWWLFLGLIPLVGAIVLIVFAATEGDKGGNRYGTTARL